MDVPPKIVGRYEIRREIGRGMMGVVYEALDPALARTIALKTIHISFPVGTGEHVAFEERFFAEARIAARLSHPGIVIVHDVGRDAQTGTLYIAMEWLRGRNLAELIREGVTFDWRQSLSVVLRIAEALHHAHTEGVIHRDLKPANIMLLPSGEPKLLDFGIAKAETSRFKVTSDGQFFGTPLYMSPEQALGKDLDARSDLFSLGAVAYNLLTGKAAFAAPSVVEIVRRVIEDDPTPASTLVREMPPEVDRIVARALAKDPGARYPDGETMAEDLKEILGGRAPHESIAVAPPTIVAASPPSRPRATSGPSPIEPLVAPAIAIHEVGVATRPGGDLQAELETLIGGLTPLDEPGSPRPSVVAGSDPPATPSSAAPSPTPASAPSRGRLLVAGAAVAALLGVLGTGAWFFWVEAPTDTVARPSGLPSVGSPPAAASAPPSTPAPTRPPDPPRSAPATTAELAIDFEHPLKDGSLRVWVDGKLALDEDLTGRPGRSLVGLKVHKGSLEKTLAVKPGPHVVGVRVKWDDNVKEETIRANFKAGERRLLEIRLGRLRKNLSVDWK